MTDVTKTAFRQLSGRTVEWEIKDFRNLPFVGKQMLSPAFWVSNSKWQIAFYPKRKTSGEKYVSLFLHKLSKNYPVRVLYTLLIKVNNSLIAEVDDFEKTFDQKINSWGKSPFAERSKILECLKPETSNDTIIVVCSIRIKNSIKEVSTQTLGSCHILGKSNVEELSNSNVFSDDETANGSKKLSNDQGVQTLSNNFKKLYLNQEHSDLEIKVESKEFSAHKLILSARSPVFASMFRHEMTENLNGTLDISDCEPKSFEVFLEFLYTGKMDGVCYSNAIGLYKTADKYEVDDLKEKCVSCLCEGMDVEYMSHSEIKWNFRR